MENTNTNTNKQAHANKLMQMQMHTKLQNNPCNDNDNQNQNYNRLIVTPNTPLDHHCITLNDYCNHHYHSYPYHHNHYCCHEHCRYRKVSPVDVHIDSMLLGVRFGCVGQHSGRRDIYKTSQELWMLPPVTLTEGSLWMLSLLFSFVRNVISVSKVTNL